VRPHLVNLWVDVQAMHSILLPVRPGFIFAPDRRSIRRSPMIGVHELMA
jgi:hypothetical protein